MAENRTTIGKVLHVCKTPEQWAAEETIISKGILCVEIESSGATHIKVGDGVSKFSALPYVTDGAFKITDYYTKTEADGAIAAAIAKLGDIWRIKGTVATVDDLPTTGNTVGDVYFVKNEGEDSGFSEYIWTTEGKWEFLGVASTAVDLVGYAKTEYVDTEIGKVNDKITPLETKAHQHTNSEILDNTTASFTTEEKEKLAAIDAEANKYELPKASETELGGVKVGTNLSIDENGVMSAADTTYETMTGATEGAAGAAGLVPAPTAGSQSKFLKGDGTWDTVPAYDDTEIGNRVTALETDALKSTDTLVINCTL